MHRWSPCRIVPYHSRDLGLIPSWGINPFSSFPGIEGRVSVGDQLNLQMVGSWLYLDQKKKYPGALQVE